MNEELCFCIEGKNLYLEQTLVDYMNIPIFFLCKDSLSYYVALCTDINDLHYVIVSAPVSDIYALLHGRLPMRNIFLKQSAFWQIISGEDIASDIVTKFPILQLDTSVLPEADACFKILTDSAKSFVQKFDNEFLNDLHFNRLVNHLNLTKAQIADIENLPTTTIPSFTNIGDYCCDFKIESSASTMPMIYHGTDSDTAQASASTPWTSDLNAKKANFSPDDLYCAAA